MFTKANSLNTRFALFAILLILGCGGGVARDRTVPVKGVVLFRGQPLADASVTFSPEKGRPATGTTNASGEFTLTTYENNDGAIPGQHMILVTKYEPAPAGDPYAKLKSIIPERYSELRTTPLTKTVENGDNPRIEIVIEE